MVAISMSKEELRSGDTACFDEYYAECTEEEVHNIMSMMRSSLDEYDFNDGRVISQQVDSLVRGFTDLFGKDPSELKPEEIELEFKYIASRLINSKAPRLVNN